MPPFGLGLRGALTILLVTASLLTACSTPAFGVGPAAGVGFKAATGGYTIRFTPKSGTITVSRGKVGLAIREPASVKQLDLLHGATSIRHTGSAYTVRGKTSWASFSLRLDLPRATPGLIHLTLQPAPKRHA